jgi:hypothetical protein
VFHCIRDIGILERSVVCGQDSTYQKDQIQRRYFNTHQRPNQTIEDYYEYFQEVLRNFNDIGLKKPKRSEQIVRFLASLNRDLYVDLHRDINNSPQHNILKFKTLQEAYAFAVHYQPSTSSPLVASSVNPVVIPTLELEHLEIRTSSHHISQRKHTKSDEATRCYTTTYHATICYTATAGNRLSVTLLARCRNSRQVLSISQTEKRMAT